MIYFSTDQHVAKLTQANYLNIYYEQNTRLIMKWRSFLDSITMLMSKYDPQNIFKSKSFC